MPLRKLSDSQAELFHEAKLMYENKGFDTAMDFVIQVINQQEVPDAYIHKDAYNPVDYKSTYYEKDRSRHNNYNNDMLLFNT